MKTWFVIPVVAALLLAVGCDERPLTSVEYDPAAAFSGFKTYRWLEDSGRITADRPQAEPEVCERVLRAVDRALAEKGFTLSTAATADFMVGYHVGLHRRPDVRSMNAYYNYPPGWAWDHYRYGRELAPRDAEQPAMLLEDKGAVVIDVATAAEGRLIWRGTAYTVVPERRPASVDQEWLDQRAKELFDQFPPAP